jgi:uncharacterized damage-inducible protein DinB
LSWLEQHRALARYNRLMNLDFAVLAAERTRTDGDILAFVEGLDSAVLERPLAHHHRGQVTTLLRQAGIDPGSTSSALASRGSA